MKQQNISTSGLGCWSLSFCHLPFNSPWVLVFFNLSLFLLPFLIFFLIVYLKVWMHSQQTSQKSRDSVHVWRRHFLFPYTFPSSVMNRCYFTFRPTGTTVLRSMNLIIHLSTVLMQDWSIHRLELKKDQFYKSYLQFKCADEYFGGSSTY